MEDKIEAMTIDERIKVKETEIIDLQHRRAMQQVPAPSKPKPDTIKCIGCDRLINRVESASRYYRCKPCYEKMLDFRIISPYFCMGCGDPIELPYDNTYLISKHCPKCFPKWERIGR